MKTKVFIIIICCILGTKLNKAQEIFPISDAIWNINEGGKERMYGLSGDTIINDTLYQKLYFLNDTTLIIDNNDEYVGGIRQGDKKVYFRPAYFTNTDIHGNPIENYLEILLYDFSKNVGDTIWHGNFTLGDKIPVPYFNTFPSTTRKEVSIITDIQGNEGNRKFKIERRTYSGGEFRNIGGFWDADEWMEGIGSIYRGLFWFFYEPSLSGTPNTYLSCFKHGNEVKFLKYPMCSSCFCWDGMGLKNNKNSKALINYYPEDHSIKIETNNHPSSFELIDVKGCTILNIFIKSDPFYIPVSSDMKGFYFYKILQNNETQKTGKIVLY